MTDRTAADSEVARARELILGLARAIESQSPGDFARSGDLHEARVLAIDLCGDLYGDLGGDVDLNDVLSRARHLSHLIRRLFRLGLAHALDHEAALDLIGALVRAKAEVSARTAGNDRYSALMARRLVAAAVGLLPASDRNRYLEEFRAEVNDLARARHGRRAQAMYGARLLASALQLRAELRTPGRRGAAQ
jgi:hypothetical protein